MAQVPVYEFLTASGTLVGCGTQVELDYWSANDGPMAGFRVGKIISYEPASEDERRKAAWAKYDAKIAA